MHLVYGVGGGVESLPDAAAEPLTGGIFFLILLCGNTVFTNIFLREHSKTDPDLSCPHLFDSLFTVSRKEPLEERVLTILALAYYNVIRPAMRK